MKRMTYAKNNQVSYFETKLQDVEVKYSRLKTSSSRDSRKSNRENSISYPKLMPDNTRLNMSLTKEASVKRAYRKSINQGSQISSVEKKKMRYYGNEY